MLAAPLEVARRDLGLSVLELWTAYFALGGLRSVNELGAYLTTGGPSSTADHDAIVHALNEAYLDRGERASVGYSED